VNNYSKLSDYLICGIEIEILARRILAAIINMGFKPSIDRGTRNNLCPIVSKV
jgi:hypothetical protein